AGDRSRRRTMPAPCRTRHRPDRSRGRRARVETVWSSWSRLFPFPRARARRAYRSWAAKSEEQVVLEKLVIAQPAAGFVQSLRRLVHHACAENEPFGARFYRVLPGPLEKC